MLQTSGIDILYDIQQAIITRLDDALAKLQICQTTTSTAAGKGIETYAISDSDQGFSKQRSNYDDIAAVVRNPEAATIAESKAGFFLLRTGHAALVAKDAAGVTLAVRQDSGEKEMQLSLIELKQGMMQEIKQEFGSLRLQVDRYHMSQ